MIERRVGSAATSALVAWKGTGYAKSRLAVTPTLRRHLAEAMALDTLRALASALPAVAVTTDDPRLGTVLETAGIAVDLIVDAGPGGLNAALARADRRLRAVGVCTVVACVADLPALRGTSVAAVVDAARPGTRSFVRDRSGIGTTMLVADGVVLDPRFEGPSADAHHRSGAVDLVGGTTTIPADARLDVDTVEDLDLARTLGLGPATAPLVSGAATSSRCG